MPCNSQIKSNREDVKARATCRTPARLATEREEQFGSIYSLHMRHSSYIKCWSNREVEHSEADIGLSIFGCVCRSENSKNEKAKICVYRSLLLSQNELRLLILLLFFPYLFCYALHPHASKQLLDPTIKEDGQLRYWPTAYITGGSGICKSCAFFLAFKYFQYPRKSRISNPVGPMIIYHGSVGG